VTDEAGPASGTAPVGEETPLSDEAPAPDPAPEKKPPPLLVESIGGWRGLFDSGVPVVVFIAVNAIAGLTAAVWSAVGVAALLSAFRLVRKQTVQQAVSGFLGVAVAAYIASRTGQAKGFFLLGIWASFGYGAIFLASVLARWPLVGLVWEYVDGGMAGKWRKQAPLMRVYTWTTLVWVAVFLARGTVQRLLYNQDKTGWLAFARLAMGYPLTAGVLALTIVAVRRVRRGNDVTGDDDYLDGTDLVEDVRPAEGPGAGHPAGQQGAGTANSAGAGGGSPAQQPA
jgi:Protein of unknown function (DUF3159)